MRTYSRLDCFKASAFGIQPPVPGPELVSLPVDVRIYFYRVVWMAGKKTKQKPRRGVGAKDSGYNYLIRSRHFNADQTLKTFSQSTHRDAIQRLAFWTNNLWDSDGTA